MLLLSLEKCDEDYHQELVNHLKQHDLITMHREMQEFGKKLKNDKSSSNKIRTIQTSYLNI
jgi:hypothetical protein